MHSQKFEIPVNGASVCGELHVPATASNDNAAPAVLICRGVTALDDATDRFLAQTCATLAREGVAAARLEHRCAGLILEDFDSHTAQNDIEDAGAVYDWLSSHESVDPRAIGVLGYCLGGIAAAALAGRCRAVARLCLVAACTARHARACLARDRGAYGSMQAANLPQQYLPSLESIDSEQDAAEFEGRTLVIHAAADAVVPLQVSTDFARALRLAKRRVEQIQVARADHSFTSAAAREVCIEHVVRFFRAMIATEPVAIAGQSSP